MEHRFITPGDGFIRAIAICRQRLLDCNAETVIGTLLNRRVKQNVNVEAGVTQVECECPVSPGTARDCHRDHFFLYFSLSLLRRNSERVETYLNYFAFPFLFISRNETRNLGSCRFFLGVTSIFVTKKIAYTMQSLTCSTLLSIPSVWIILITRHRDCARISIACLELNRGRPSREITIFGNRSKGNESRNDASNTFLFVPQVSPLRPEMPLEVSRWMESNEISSAMLRQVPIATTTTMTTTTTTTATTTIITHC